MNQKKLSWVFCLFSSLALGLTPLLVQAQPSVDDSIRFLEQSTFGPNQYLIDRVQQLGFDGWITEQFGTPSTGWADRGLCPGNPGPPCQPTRDFYTMYPVQIEFYQKALTAPDQLRARVDWALDQLWVISAFNGGNYQAGWMDYYLQIIDRNAFGNFRDLMAEITLSPGMGKYLDMAGNTRNNPNENYAREILQLFCVGLDELRDDGTPILDDNGQPIPTYNQDMVISFSRVFTGWNLAPPDQGNPNWRDPMVLNQGQHDVNEKVLFDGWVLEAGQSGDDDLRLALDNIFYNHNVPPFISKQLIQKLVTSNPSPDYVLRVTQVFQDNGSGVRGDMQAVIRAVLMDPEARNAPGPDFGKLREPVLAVTRLLRAFYVDDPDTDFVLGESYIPGNLRLDEDVFRSPTVFNFYPPNFPMGDSGLVGPEFAIQSTNTAFARINLMNALIYTGIPPNPPDRPLGTKISPYEMAAYAQGTVDELVDGLNTVLLHDTMSPEMRQLLVDTVSAIGDPTARAQYAIYLIATSSSFQVQR